MKASQLIVKLNQMIEIHGDLDVAFYCHNFYKISDISKGKTSGRNGNRPCNHVPDPTEAIILSCFPGQFGQYSFSRKKEEDLEESDLYDIDEEYESRTCEWKNG